MTMHMLTIKILEIGTRQTPLRNVDIIISNGTDHYRLGVGGLPLEGDLQLELYEREAELWQAAQIVRNQKTTDEVRRVCYNSPLAGGWSKDEFQEAFNENFGGKKQKLRRIKALRDTIRDEWPIA
ncbi:hypothetical protein LCGC14_0561730 [marine sediment metagenome]|uniref:Uncharacterized protein n=1 Tax=marine sediment metagenome TaxID=412755 RepID=A0A0F9U869_9ZZZZ